MRKTLWLAVLLIAATSLSARGIVGPDLTSRLPQTRSNELLSVNIILAEQADNTALEARCKGLTKNERWALVVGELKDQAARTQAPILSALNGLAAQGKVSDITPLWIVNGIYCQANPEAINAIAELDGINYIEYSLVYTKLPECITPETYDKMIKGNVTVPTDATEWNVKKVGADSVWNLLGYTGSGVIVGHIDTGINYNHVDFAGHLWSDPAYPHNGWNFESGNGDNIDVNGHGTHTAGTVCSNGTAGDTCGMAPRSQVMTCRVRTTADSTAEEQCFQAMQFCVAPPLSPSNHAHCITMSLGWQIAWAPRQATWRQSVWNVSTAGLPFAIAAGNERGGVAPPNDLRCPGNVPGPWKHPAEANGGRGGCISIAATDASDNIASFSSQGPVSWSSIPPYNDYAYPPGLIHPDVAAPGVNVTSCAYNNNSGYLSGWSGTSMATPCVAGTIALMLEKNPNLQPADVDSILQLTVKPLGSQPKNNDFGTGRISAYAAVGYVTGGAGGPNLNITGQVINDPPPGGNSNGRLDPGESGTLVITLRNSGAAACNNTVGTLASGDARLVVTDPNGTWGNIPSGGSADNSGNPFGLSAGSGITPGTSIPCTLHVTGDSADYAKTFVFSIVVGQPPVQPGTIIWGPKTIPNPPGFYSIYGMAYDGHNNHLYVCHFNVRRIDIMSSDSLLTNLGNIPTPNAESGCTDIKYCAYDNTFWVHTNVTKRIYKIDTAGNVLRYFSSPAVDYPCGLGWDEVTRTLYLTDRRSINVNPDYLYTIDTLGNTVHARIDYPFVSYAGARTLAIDRTNSNPLAPTLINLYTWFDTGGGLDSIGVYELKHDTFQVLNHFMISNIAWNCRGIEIDPRDGNLWISIMQNLTPPPTDNSIFKCTGFHQPTGIEEKPFLVATGDAMWCRAAPNPFQQMTRLSYLLAKASSTRLVIYDASGRVVRTLVNGRMPAGEHSVTWNGRDDRGELSAPGIYFYDFETGSGKLTGKALLLK
jgi:subtilisin family serine protease